jgi:Cu/Ag efflux protein CusF
LFLYGRGVEMKFFSFAVLVISFISLAFALNNVKQLKNIKKSFEITRNELTKEKREFATHKSSQWPKFYDVNGKLLFKPGGNRLIIDHEEIPKLMPKMIMSYEVEDPKQIEKLEPGDKVHFRLEETADKLFIINIEKGM